MGMIDKSKRSFEPHGDHWVSAEQWAVLGMAFDRQLFRAESILRIISTTSQIPMASRTYVKGC